MVVEVSCCIIHDRGDGDEKHEVRHVQGKEINICDAFEARTGKDNEVEDVANNTEPNNDVRNEAVRDPLDHGQSDEVLLTGGSLDSVTV